MRDCRVCGCTEERACLEFDAKGYAHACYWLDWRGEPLCSACGLLEQSDPLPFGESGDTRLVVGRREISAGGRRSQARRFLSVPQLAGMVARPRRPKKARW